MKFLDESSDELIEIVTGITESNGISKISEELLHELYIEYVFAKIKVVILSLFYVFVIALLIVYLLASEELGIPRWTKIIFSLALIRLIPLTSYLVKEEAMEKVANKFVKILNDNSDSIIRKG